MELYPDEFVNKSSSDESSSDERDRRRKAKKKKKRKRYCALCASFDFYSRGSQLYEKTKSSSMYFETDSDLGLDVVHGSSFENPALSNHGIVG